ncbi:MAG TPA: hypothetical protein VF278_02605 [Pirellulales bacterium]
MAKRAAATADYDSPWKAALHKYLQSFLAFFFPPIHADIDWIRGYDALDKEFQQIVRRAQVGKQIYRPRPHVAIRRVGKPGSFVLSKVCTSAS